MVSLLVVTGVLFAPLAAACAIPLFFLRSPRASGVAALVGILVAFAGSLNLFFESLLTRSVLPHETSFPWIRTGGLEVPFGYLIDPLSVLMLLVVTGVGSCIFLYSLGYMKEDPSQPRYFASLSLFAFAMIGIVVSNNLLLLFVFWELVAVSSYLLIGFWFEKPAAAAAGQKAFIVNRLADFGFLLGILGVWALSGAGGERTFVFSKLAEILPQGVANGTIPAGAATAAALLVFCGAAGKSAQFPLYIWLPDAMEGPTPVSALIHAATMVAAGVYLLARTFFLLGLSASALFWVAVIGALTAFLAAALAVVQNDVKRILAYSTVSQLGTMMTALGLGGADTAMFHLTTHAFFKALLFLGAGAMIHALHTQDIREMGGLVRRMPVTAVTFLIGTLALCGIWPTAGFFSKDAILALAFERAPALFALGTATAALTAFYMGRAAFTAVLGPVRGGGANGHDQVHDAPLVMRAPLVVLAAFSLAGGFLGIERFLAGPEAGHAHHPPIAVPVAATLAALAGLGAGALLYGRPRGEDPLKRLPAVLYGLLDRKYYLDDLFYGLADVFQGAVASALGRFDAAVVIRGGVNGAARAAAAAGSALRRLQTGLVSFYAMLFSAGVVLVLAFALWGT
jgi:NADH-quinone oxidoreductase subunit L